MYEVRIFNRIDNTGCLERAFRFRINRYVKREGSWKMFLKKMVVNFSGEWMVSLLYGKL